MAGMNTNRKEPGYTPGFGNHVATEAIEGTLPQGRNSPQKPAFGLYAEQFSGSAFTAPRAENRRSWLYRLRPSAMHRPFLPYEDAPLFTAALPAEPLAPNRLRWDPPAMPDTPTDFIDGIVTLLRNGDAERMEGVAFHLYAANRDMDLGTGHSRVFVNADGELLLIPQLGRLDLLTEMGRIAVSLARLP
jgi:homogentisate 1,2-dioxygenase